MKFNSFFNIDECDQCDQSNYECNLLNESKHLEYKMFVTNIDHLNNNEWNININLITPQNENMESILNKISNINIYLSHYDEFIDQINRYKSYIEPIKNNQTTEVYNNSNINIFNNTFNNLNNNINYITNNVNYADNNINYITNNVNYANNNVNYANNNVNYLEQCVF